MDKIKQEYENKIKNYQSMIDNANSSGEKRLKDLMDEWKKVRENYENEKKIWINIIVIVIMRKKKKKKKK